MVSFKWSAIDVTCVHLLGDRRLLWVVEQAWDEYFTITGLFGRGIVQIVACDCLQVSGWKPLNFARAGACPRLVGVFRERLTDVRQFLRWSTRSEIVASLVAAIRMEQMGASTGY